MKHQLLDGHEAPSGKRSPWDLMSYQLTKLMNLIEAVWHHKMERNEIFVRKQKVTKLIFFLLRKRCFEVPSTISSAFDKNISTEFQHNGAKGFRLFLLLYKFLWNRIFALWACLRLYCCVLRMKMLWSLPSETFFFDDEKCILSENLTVCSKLFLLILGDCE